MADFENRGNVALPGMLTGNRDLVTSPSVFRWLLEGKCFEAGFGPEDAQENSQAALNDEAPTFALRAPTGTTTLVVPLLLKIMLTTDGDAATAAYVTFTRPAADCATANTLSGTALTFKRNMNRLFSTQGNATPLYGDGITSAALTNADYVCYDQRIVMDNTLAATHMGGSSSNLTLDFMRTGVPHVLAKQAAMLVFLATGTADSVAKVYMQWAELEAADLY